MNVKQSKTVIILSHYGMSSAEPALSHKLLDGYLGLLRLQEQRPASILCYGEGVKVACEGSPFLEVLAALEAQGVSLGICTTCLKHFQLLDKLRVGSRGKMEDVVKAHLEADKVITL